ncbi:hypothetical protein TorRG33x02_268470, partial [Trema orientale]
HLEDIPACLPWTTSMNNLRGTAVALGLKTVTESEILELNYQINLTSATGKLLPWSSPSHDSHSGIAHS